MIRIALADLTSLDVDALVRSVGTDLEACTPICARVGVEAGEELLDRMRRTGDVPVGGAIVTPAGQLKSAFLIHVVLRSEEEPISEESVARAFRNGLRQAAQWQVASVAMPPLGIGAGNLDAEVSARVMCSVLRDHSARFAFPKDVVIAVANAYEEEAFTNELARMPRSEALRGAREASVIQEADSRSGGEDA